MVLVLWFSVCSYERLAKVSNQIYLTTIKSRTEGTIPQYGFHTSIKY